MCVHICYILVMVFLRELVRAVQKRNKSLEEEYKELSNSISELNAQLQSKEKVSMCRLVVSSSTL